MVPTLALEPGFFYSAAPDLAPTPASQHRFWGNLIQKVQATPFAHYLTFSRQFDVSSLYWTPSLSLSLSRLSGRRSDAPRAARSSTTIMGRPPSSSARGFLKACTGPGEKTAIVFVKRGKLYFGWTSIIEKKKHIENRLSFKILEKKLITLIHKRQKIAYLSQVRSKFLKKNLHAYFL